MGRGVQDDRLAATDRDPRPVGAVVQLVEADERRSMQGSLVAGHGDWRRRRPSRPRIDEAQRAVVLHEGQRPAVGAEVEVDEPSPSPRTTPIAAGLFSSAARRLPRVCSESSSATPWRASSSDRSRSSSVSACAPSRWASAATASSCALPRSLSATAPAITATTRSAATPARTHPQAAVGALRSRRALVEEGPLARRPARDRGRPPSRGPPPGARRDRARRGRGRPRPIRSRRCGGGGAAAGLRRRPPASRAGAATRAAGPRARPRPRPR